MALRFLDSDCRLSGLLSARIFDDVCCTRYMLDRLSCGVVLLLAQRGDLLPERGALPEAAYLTVSSLSAYIA